MRKVHARWLHAAGIHDQGLRAAYEECRRLHAAFGRTYYLATLLLPPAKRPYVSSLYGFARYADEIVDNGAPETRADTLTRWSDAALADLRRGDSTDPVRRALLHTMKVWNIRADHIEAFLASMLMDLTVTEYPAYADLQKYMYGSAAVIGLEMTPILEPLADGAYERAHALGEAFQLTNFLRDIGEDLDRGRLYLPLSDLDAFGVTREELETRRVTRRIRELLRYEIHRTRRIYTFAAEGIDLLALSSRECIRTALALYGGILDEIERADHQVFARRASVGLLRRFRVALPAYVRARRLWAESAA